MNKKITIAISSYRSHKSVIPLITKILEDKDQKYIEIILVDSEPNGSLDVFCLINNIKYIKSDTNLGSAGNLKIRLEEAAKNIDSDWCLCLNHDAFYSSSFSKTFIKNIDNVPNNTGAIFPSRTYNNGYKVNVDKLTKKRWGSSNGCIYSLKPTRENTKVRDELWMGWEDYLYCIELENKKYMNFLAPSEYFIDSYEYKEICFFKTKLKLNNKPSWYDYYSIRNLIFILKYVGFDKETAFLIFKITINSLILSCLKDEPIKRIRYYLKGLYDGYKGNMGKREL